MGFNEWGYPKMDNGDFTKWMICGYPYLGNLHMGRKTCSDGP